MSIEIWNRKSISGGFFLFLLLIALATSIALLVGKVIGSFDSSIWVLIIGAIILPLIIMLRQDEIAATIVAFISLYFDWYVKQGFVIAQIVTLVLLLIFYLTRSSRYPWVTPRALWLWILFLVLAIFPALQAITINDGIYYYWNIIFSALIMFWLGIVIGRDIASVRRFLKFFSFFGTLIAIHVIILVATGVFLFKTTVYDLYLALVVSNYQLAGSTDVYRVGSFLINPDSAGGFFSMMLFLPLGLFCESSFLPGKILYIAEIFLIFLALLFTYSTGGWIPAFVAFIVFIAFVGSTYYRIILLLFTFIVVTAVIIIFPTQVNLQLEHVGASGEIQLRVAAWLTGIHVIQTFPLTGIGLGRYGYIVRAYPYRVDPSGFLVRYQIPLYHPQNSYLELAALGGLPVAIVFIVLLTIAIWLALRNWVSSDVRTRSLFAAGIASVTALSINSLANTGWTLPPLAATGWIILGVISSPLLMKSRTSELMKERNISVKNIS